MGGAVVASGLVTDSFSHSAIALVEPPAAWLALQRPDVWEEIAGVQEVVDPRFDEAGTLTSYRFTVKAGPHTVRGSAQTVEALEPDLMRIRISSPEIVGAITTELAPHEETATLVTVSVEMRAKGILASLFYPVVSQAVRNGLPDQVHAFAEKLGT